MTDTERRDIERPEWETKHTITHAEARQVAERFIAGHFGNAGKEYPRITIPANPERDDDLLLMSYIAQQERCRAQPSPREVALEKALRGLRNEVFALLSCWEQCIREVAGNTNVACLKRSVETAEAALSQASDGREG